MAQTKLTRRVVLSAAGAVVALPLLEGLGFRRNQGRAQTPPSFRYAIFIRQGNGVQQGVVDSEPQRFWPSQLGPLTRQSLMTDAAADRTVGTLADYADKLLVVRGSRYNFSTSGCGHADGGLQCLTAARPDGPYQNRALAMGESIDNRIVRELSEPGVEPLTLYAGQKNGYLDDVLSYRGPMDRRAAEANPFNVYRRLFGTHEVDPDVEAMNRLTLARRSVNDLVRDQIQAFQRRTDLSMDDQARLRLHFEAIRDVEVNMAMCQLPMERFNEIQGLNGSTVGRDDMIETITRMQMDIIALAMSCGVVPAATLQIGNGNDQTQYLIDGVRQERFHHVSHRINGDGDVGDPIPDAVDKHHRIDLKFAGFFQYMLDRLSSYTTPNGTLLDEGVTIWTNDLANGPPHGSRNLPYICAGSCGGALRTGQYVDAGAGASGGGYVTNNRFLSTIGSAVGCTNSAGEPLDDFGDPELTRGRVDAMLT